MNIGIADVLMSGFLEQAIEVVHDVFPDRISVRAQNHAAP